MNLSSFNRNAAVFATQGKDAVPDTVDHVLVSVDPKEDRSWLQSLPKVETDNVHALDKTGEPYKLSVLTCEVPLARRCWAASRQRSPLSR